MLQALGGFTELFRDELQPALDHLGEYEEVTNSHNVYRLNVEFDQDFSFMLEGAGCMHHDDECDYDGHDANVLDS